MTNLVFPTTLAGALRGAETVLALVPQASLKAGWLGEAVAQPWCEVLEKAGADEEAGPQGKTLVLVNPGKGPTRSCGNPTASLLMAAICARISSTSSPDSPATASDPRIS